MARRNEREDEYTWPLARRPYRSVRNPRFNHHYLLKGLYGVAQRAVARHAVLLATLFVYFIDHTWPQKAVLWLCRLGGKLGLSFDPDGPYILLAGISAVLVTVSAITFALRHPFPRAG